MVAIVKNVIRFGFEKNDYVARSVQLKLDF